MLCTLSVLCPVELCHIPSVSRFPAWGQDCPVSCVSVFLDEGLPPSSYEFPMKKALRQGWSYIQEMSPTGDTGRDLEIREGCVMDRSTQQDVVWFLNLPETWEFVQGTHRSPVLFIHRTVERRLLGTGSLIPWHFWPLVLEGKRPLIPTVGGSIWTQAFILKQRGQGESGKT